MSGADPAQEPISFIPLYNSLQIVGFLSCSVVGLTAAFSRRISRSANWYMAFAFAALWSIEWFLLVGHQTGPPPPYGLCLIQASLIYAASPSVVFAVECILLQIYLSLLGSLYQKRALERRLSALLLFVPPLIHAVVFFVSLSIGLNEPSSVRRSPTGMYCNMSHAVPQAIAAIGVIVSAAIMFVFEVLTFTLLYKHRATIKKINANPGPGSNPISITLAVRVALFSVGPVAAVGLGLSSMGDSSSYDRPLTVILTATSAVIVAGIFGTQKDIITTWMFWKPAQIMIVHPASSKQGSHA